MAKHFQLVRPDINIDFMKARHISLLVSFTLVLLSFYIWNAKGMDKFGTDFAGGTEVLVKFDKPLASGDVREALRKAGFEQAVVQSFDNTNEFSIRLRTDSGSEVGKRIRDALQTIPDAKFEVRKEDFVGPIIGEEIRNKGLKATVISLLGILLYVGIRFEWRFALGAVLALFHDVIITSGIYVLSGRDVSAAFLAAILTIIGYSINDTIVVFDRVRENMVKREKKKAGSADQRDRESAFREFKELLNQSINQTLSRTLLTACATLFSVCALWLIATGELSDLAFALFVGILFGTYSSIFVASYLVLLLEKPRGTAAA